MSDSSVDSRHLRNTLLGALLIFVVAYGTKLVLREAPVPPPHIVNDVSRERIEQVLEWHRNNRIDVFGVAEAPEQVALNSIGEEGLHDGPNLSVPLNITLKMRDGLSQRTLYLFKHPRGYYLAPFGVNPALPDTTDLQNQFPRLS